jgi:DNA-binding YbaB/EbfC family protein
MSGTKPGLPDLQAFFGKMQAFQEKMERMQESLGAETVEAESGGGMIKVVANGRREVLSITIEPGFEYGDDLTMLQDLVTAAVNAALRKADERMKEKMESSLGQMAGGMIPNLFGQ